MPAVGLICGPQTVTTGIRRRDGFLSAFTESGLKIPESMIHYGDFYEQSGVLGAKKLTSVKRRPTLLAVMNNAMALGVMSYLRTSGISVPEDLSFVSYGDIHNRDLLYFQPTILAQNPRKIGELAAAFLMQRLANLKKEGQNIMLSGELTVGDSVLDIS